MQCLLEEVLTQMSPFEDLRNEARDLYKGACDLLQKLHYKHKPEVYAELSEHGQDDSETSMCNDVSHKLCLVTTSGSEGSGYDSEVISLLFLVSG